MSQVTQRPTGSRRKQTQSQRSQRTRSSRQTRASLDDTEDNASPPDSSDSDSDDDPSLSSVGSQPSGSSQGTQGTCSTNHGFAKESVTRKGRPYFRCYCRKRYTTKKALGNHIRSEKVGRMFKCTECSSRFYSNADLKKHLKKVHDEAPPVTYGCHDCGDIFDTPEKLSWHRKFAEGHGAVKLGLAKVGPAPSPQQPRITQFFTIGRGRN